MATELVGKVLTILLRLREAEYPTTLEEDENLLQTGRQSHRKIMALKVRLGEKYILREAIQKAGFLREATKE